MVTFCFVFVELKQESRIKWRIKLKQDLITLSLLIKTLIKYIKLSKVYYSSTECWMLLFVGAFWTLKLHWFLLSLLQVRRVCIATSSDCFRDMMLISTELIYRSWWFRGGWWDAQWRVLTSWQLQFPEARQHWFPASGHWTEKHYTSASKTEASLNVMFM